MAKTAAMVKWETAAGIQVEDVLARYGEEYRSMRELATELSKKGTRVTEGTAYLWLRRYQSWAELRRLGYV